MGAVPGADPLRRAVTERCAWVGKESVYVAYHDTEWGVPEHEDRALFEKLILDGFQAGLSWITILRKRDNFRAAFDGFEPETVAQYGPEKIDALLSDRGIIRNRAKVLAAVSSARAYVDLRKSGTTFDDFLWRFTEGRTIRNRWSACAEIPAETAESRAMSKALKAAGFRFCGPVTCYAFMQAIGMVNDHVLTCPRYEEL